MRSVVYKWIPIEKKFWDLINCDIVQALKGKLQLTGVDKVFPDARHSRFEHSIGVGHVARLFVEKLLPDDKHSQDVAFICGVLHDMCHGPFSHTWDKWIYPEIYISENKYDAKGHDIHRLKFLDILSPQLELCGVTISDVKSVWQGTYPVLSSLFQGPLSPDRIDYMLRDSLFTATEHFGNIDPFRLMDNCKVVTDIKTHKSTLQFSEKCFSDIVRFLIGRYHMYEIYLHKTAVAACILVERALELASQIPSLNFKKQTLDYSEFVKMSDETVLQQILDHQINFYADQKLIPAISEAKVCVLRYKQRKLPKLICEKVITKEQYQQMVNYDHHKKTFVPKNATKPVSEMFYKVFEDEYYKLISNFAFQNNMIDFDKFYFWQSRGLDTINVDSFDKKQIYFYNEFQQNISFKTLLQNSPPYKQYLNSGSNQFYIFRMYVDTKDLQILCKKILYS